MNRKNFRTFIRMMITCICTFAIACPVWAAGESAGAVSDAGSSRVITAGDGAETDDTAAETDEISLEAPPSGQASTGKGISLGMFTTTGYCNCAICSGGFNLTYSGTVPKARHTISADLSVFPIGTRLMINDVVYTVEDMGSGVTDNKLDIYYDNHADALAHGRRQLEVFTVVE